MPEQHSPDQIELHKQQVTRTLEALAIDPDSADGISLQNLADSFQLPPHNRNGFSSIIHAFGVITGRFNADGTLRTVPPEEQIERKEGAVTITSTIIPDSSRPRGDHLRLDVLYGCVILPDGGGAEEVRHRLIHIIGGQEYSKVLGKRQTIDLPFFHERTETHARIARAGASATGIVPFVRRAQFTEE